MRKLLCSHQMLLISYPRSFQPFISICKCSNTLLTQCAIPTTAFSRPQVRTLKLWKTTIAKTALGNHKIKAFDPFEFPEHLRKTTPPISLQVPQPGQHAITETVPFDEVLQHHIKPGVLLVPQDVIHNKNGEKWEIKRDQMAENNENEVKYTLKKCEEERDAKRRKRMYSEPGTYKEIHIGPHSKLGHYPHMLEKAWQLLLAKSVVEVQMRHTGTKGTTLPKAYGLEGWEWYLWRFPHLRPDVMIKSMPEGTFFLVHPWTDGNIVAWVLGRDPPGRKAGESLTHKTHNMKQAQLYLDEKNQGMALMVDRKKLSKDERREMATANAMANRDPKLLAKLWKRLEKLKGLSSSDQG